MPEKEKKTKSGAAVLHSGGLSAVVMLGLLSLAALMQPNIPLLQNHPEYTGAVILLLCAVLNGAECGRRLTQNRLLFGELGCAVLLAILLLLGWGSGSAFCWGRLLTNTAISAFGTFAGILLFPKKTGLRGARRKYRK